MAKVITPPNIVSWRISAVIFAIASVVAVHAEEPDSPEKLAESFEAAYTRLNAPIRELAESYVRALEALADSRQTTGDLEAVLATKKEIEAFGDGTEFDREEFENRQSEFEELENLRDTYLKTRELRWSDSAESRLDLAEKYRSALLRIEQNQTRAGNLELASVTKTRREALDDDPRFFGLEASATDGSFEGRVHFVAKGEVELRIGDDEIGYRDAAPGDKYIGGLSRPWTFRPGEVLRIRMRGDAVFRGIIVAIESVDGNRLAPIAASDYRYLGTDSGAETLTPEQVLGIPPGFPPSEGDGDMIELWSDHDLDKQTRAASQWIRLPTPGEWHNFAVELRPEMIRVSK